jgi:hypothetical protein
MVMKPSRRLVELILLFPMLLKLNPLLILLLEMLLRPRLMLLKH